MTDAWDFYFARVNGSLASLFVDLGLRPSVPDPRCPWLLWVFVRMQAPRDDGLSSSDEAPTLHQIEDALTAELASALKAQLVGRITTEGRREFYFYGPTADGLASTLAAAMSSFGRYSHEAGSKEDHAWSQYLEVLYPSPVDNQRIQNRRVVEHLQKEGDSLARPRPVSHWIYFRDAKDRAAFVSRVEPLGFVAREHSPPDGPDAGDRFGLTLERSDKVDWESINEVTLRLFHLAQEHAGEYDGWETSVERDA